MSWLLVALIPGLLMLAMFGLERLESGLNRDTVSSNDVKKFFEQAEPVHVDTLAREGTSRALDHLHQRQHDRADGGATSLPTRPYVRHGGNGEFRPTRHVNRV